MDSFMSWVGGKKLLRDEVLARFPSDYDKYIEVFGGAGWVLFHRPEDKKMEVFNDYNSNLVNLYRCVRDKPNKLKYRLRYVLNSREDFNIIANVYRKNRLGRMYDVDRAAKFYQLIKHSYGSCVDRYGANPRSLWRQFPNIDRAAERLQRVVIENRDFEKLIQQYDSPKSFFYCDPPYFATEDYYLDVSFKKEDHLRLHNALMNCTGKFLISYNDCDEIRRLWDKPNIYIESISRMNNLGVCCGGKKEYDELFISNYDTKGAAQQLSIFES